MSEFWQWIGNSLVLGIGATLVCDIWGQFVRLVTGIAPLDWRLVGRWIGHMPRAFTHDNIGKAQPVRAETALGWSAHYLTGIALAAAMLGIYGNDWVAAPRLSEALAFGLATVLLPFFVMQPALGAGIAAARTPRPMRARLLSVLTHGAFGVGLWCSAVLANFFQ
ncbi:DUF2938 domain-containing protein [Microbulbifer harenosus]|uniref:DUF2938 domain-containing protein n=1 Tax=Microbulbifer harenosus TaxID=2576840 RepID=A0ABY2UEP3_9GAMM|nr:MULTISPECIES: DUF2938 domain-containing protein [Microbulbifer]QIL90679.1 DUF2938 family protein [Microbulbifer sp. SH-1]TLM75707.1 DUF2938 domain-containing protein [Microbulbifer harenosus]